MKILKEIQNLEKEYEKLKKELKNSSLLNAKTNFYSTKDKNDFLKLWKKYVFFFKKLRKLIRKNNYRKFFFFVDYEKMIIKRYLLIFYFNCLVDIIKIFGKHEEFIRIFLGENFKYNYWKIAKYIYRPSFVTLLNTSSILLKIFKSKINKNLYFMLDKEKNDIGKNRRIITDYKNAYFYLKAKYLKIVYFLSKSIWKMISKTRFSTRKKWLITDKNLEKYLQVAKPWDIFLTRGNWNASNVTIPWFWKHMSMFLGNGKFLKQNFAKQFKFLKDLDDKKKYVIEATGIGVNILDIKDFILHNDYLWVSRTKFNQEKILRTIKKSLKNYKKPYDYVFNFYSNNSVVCSELVIKSYFKDFDEDDFLEVKLEKIKWQLTYPPNNFVWEIFSNNFLEPVIFLDSIEKTGKNFVSTKKELKKSAKRSRFSFMLK